MEKRSIEENIKTKLENIAHKKIMDYDRNLLGKPYYLEPRDLVYLFLELQEEYQIKIQEKDLKNQQFATVSGIAFLINHYITMETAERQQDPGKTVW